ncbi:rare lipoprotein A [Gloeomargarita lithophora Alchichica-D10]|uniref:Probable endolytic peptidoglycan transglycosylase RlpA n=1 Tax=Gloeomargarita lithophora Alchichica-D10 TaxID=1188229 RepID=A0A1J0ABB7_9CYAN|nr:septal ring lytic transglycosylase RlpA family protein [Gloeomargarita lithophora]APB33223.1 rare lipoprotein A [Gloeomargarita lithophora Alchichica-D10]
MRNTPKMLGLGTVTLISLVVGTSLLVPAAPVRSEVLKVGERTQPAAPLVTVRPHTLAGRPAATLFVRNLPIFSFLGQKSGVAVGTKVANGRVEGDPLVPATQLAARLNRLSQQRWDAKDLQVVRDDRQHLWLQYKNERLLRFDDTLTFDGLTKDQVQNALQMTNRLRLRLGNAPPLTAMTPPAGAPAQPSLAQRVLTVAVGSVRSVRSVLQGWASWYGPGFQGRRTASGEPFNPQALTAAHRTLPFGTQVRVTNLRNGQAVVVRINDRGPHIPGREIDISTGAAQAVGLIQMGTAPVRLEVLGP